MLARYSIYAAVLLASLGSAQAASAGDASVHLRVVVHIVPAVTAKIATASRDSQSEFVQSDNRADSLRIQSELAKTTWHEDARQSGSGPQTIEYKNAVLQTEIVTLK